MRAIAIFNYVEVNHAIIIKYSDGVLHHAPPHKDKIPDGTDFFVLSFGTPRKFQLGRKRSFDAFISRRFVLFLLWYSINVFVVYTRDCFVMRFGLLFYNSKTFMKFLRWWRWR